MYSIPLPLLAILAVLHCLSIRALAQIDLGTAAPFGIVATSQISNIGATIIDGELGLYPDTLTSITGFPPGLSGTVHAADGVADQAHQDARTAYNAAAALAQTTDLTGQDLGGKTLVAGTYHFSSSVGITGALTLDGQNDPNSQFVFQIGSTLITATASSVVLINGAKACNVFWQVGSSATLGTTTNFIGNILASASISLNNGVTVSGGLYALTGAVTLINDQITAQQACNKQIGGPVIIASVSAGGTMAPMVATSSSTVNMPLSSQSSLSPTLPANNPGQGASAPLLSTSLPSTLLPSTSLPSTLLPSTVLSTGMTSSSSAGNLIPGNLIPGSLIAGNSITSNSSTARMTLPTLVPSTRSSSTSSSIVFSSSIGNVTSVSSSIAFTSSIGNVTSVSSSIAFTSSIGNLTSVSSSIAFASSNRTLDVTSRPASSTPHSTSAITSMKLNVTSTGTNYTKSGLIQSTTPAGSVASTASSQLTTPSPELADSLEQTYPDLFQSSLRLKTTTFTSLGMAYTTIITIPCRTSTYYDNACSCTKTKIFPVKPIPTLQVEAAREAVTTINGIPCTTSTYYEASCSCTKTTVVPIVSTPAPQAEELAKAITIISGVPCTVTTYYESACDCVKTVALPVSLASATGKNLVASVVSTLASTQTAQVLFSCMSACMAPYVPTITESFVTTESCSATPRYRM